ncbi:hypothetical protein VitviT2T_001252 [Vitis vinifera]|uniref:Mitochondrial protein n=1 Tax=Vitis vinifera TaxID=29760 RepID=A0ABY9BFT3_VITVI|nr:hypothetical protein VitviT2T_001252 [Vitis vinifera]
MRSCLSSVSYAILVNGNAKGWVKASRVLRQGDPLSHFLFTIVADVLSRMMLRVEEKSLLESFRIGKNRTRVSHLQFANGTVFFSKSCAEELQTLKSLLLAFGQISRLKVILSIYGTHSNGWDANTLVRWSHRCPWKAIAQVFQDFSKYTRFVVGDGERIRFWEDLWWGDQPLRSQYPRLFRVVTNKNILISSILGSARPFSWNFSFHRNLSDSEIEDLECLMQSLNCMHLSTSASDARSWSLSSSGTFTVKSFFIALS